MLSILIPVYNFDVTSLVETLHQQCVDCGIAFEIFCRDDASENRYDETNKGITSLNNVFYHRLEKNLGRSRIRNAMAREAKYENLLFMDCDSEVVKKDFIRSYILYQDAGKVVCGGRVHDSLVPLDTKKTLRWKVGRRSEEIPAAERNQSPYNSFMTNNFLVPKKIFLKNLLDESLSGYGHEDTLFGFQLKRKNIPVVHIDNPLRHIGLEDAEEFLAKTENGISNLLLIREEKKLTESELKKIPLMRAYFFIQKILLVNVFLFFFRLNYDSIKKNLLSANPSLWWFNVFKIGILAKKSAG